MNVSPGVVRIPEFTTEVGAWLPFTVWIDPSCEAYLAFVSGTQSPEPQGDELFNARERRYA